MISWDMLAKMLRDMPQDDGLRVASARAPAIAAWYAMLGNWIVVLLVWVRKKTYEARHILLSKKCERKRGRVNKEQEGV